MVTLIYFGNSFINNKVNSLTNTRQQALIAGLISPPVFMIQSIQQIIRFESDGNGLDTDHWSIPVENIDLKTSIYMMALQSVYFVIIGLILDKYMGN